MAKQITIELIAKTNKAESEIEELRKEIELLKTSTDQATESQKKFNNTQKDTKEETEDLTDTVTKNGGAMAILNQLTGGLAQQFKDSYEAIAITNTNLKGLKGALLATGVGAAVVAIGLLVSNFDKVKEVLTGVTAEQKDLLKLKQKQQLQPMKHQGLYAP